MSQRARLIPKSAPHRGRVRHASRVNQKAKRRPSTIRHRLVSRPRHKIRQRALCTRCRRLPRVERATEEACCGCRGSATLVADCTAIYSETLAQSSHPRRSSAPLRLLAPTERGLCATEAANPPLTDASALRAIPSSPPSGKDKVQPSLSAHDAAPMHSPPQPRERAASATTWWK